jgi:hypothetical protein
MTRHSDEVITEAKALYHSGRRDEAVKTLTRGVIWAEQTIGAYHEDIGNMLHLLADWCRDIGNVREELIARDRGNYIINRLKQSPEEEIEAIRQRAAEVRPVSRAERDAALHHLIQKLNTHVPISFTATLDHSQKTIDQVIHHSRALAALATYSSLRDSVICIVEPTQAAPDGTLRSKPRSPLRCVRVTIGKPDLPLRLLRPFEPRSLGWRGYSNFAEEDTIITSMTNFNEIASDIQTFKYEVSEVLVGGPFS